VGVAVLPDPPDPDPVPAEPLAPEVEALPAEFTASAAPPPQEPSKNRLAAIRHAVLAATEVLCSDMLETVLTTQSSNHRG
jgi:hypothetical protein